MAGIVIRDGDSFEAALRSSKSSVKKPASFRKFVSVKLMKNLL